jgi:hypothetical protein
MLAATLRNFMNRELIRCCFPVLDSMEKLAMTQIVNILLNTPWWVFALFAALVVLGVQALRPRTIPFWQLLITPNVFIVWGVISLILQLSPSSPFLWLDWVAAAAIGSTLGWFTSGAADLRIERAGVVTVPGSVLTLVRNMLIFAAKYGLAVATVIAPTQRQQFALWDVAVSGASAGYFLGWLGALGLGYWRATRPALIVQRE